MAGEIQSVIQARRDYWANQTDDQSSQKTPSHLSTNGLNLARNESEFATSATGQNGFIPVLNVMKFSSNQNKQQVKAEKSLILIRDTSPPERNAVPAKWKQFLLEKSFNRLHREISSDDFIIRTFTDLKGDFNSIQRKIEWGSIGSILIFDDLQDEPPRSISSIEINKKEGYRLSDLLENLNGQPLFISIVSPWAANSSTRQLHELSQKFVSNSSNGNVNFLFPLVETETDDFYCFEMSVLFRLLVNQLRGYTSLADVMQTSQIELFSRINQSNLNNERICATASTSFVYFSSCEMSRSEQHDILEIGELTVPRSGFHEIDRLIGEATQRGRIRADESKLEHTCMNICCAAIKFLNTNNHIKTKYGSEIFSIALSMLHSFRCKTEKHQQLSSGEIQKLWDMFSENGGTPFSYEMQENAGKKLAPRNVIKAFEKALYNTEEPEYHLARRIIEIVKPEVNESEATDAFMPFIEELNSIHSLRNIDPSYQQWHSHVVSPHYGIFLTKAGIEAMSKAFNIHAAESGYRTAQAGVALWDENRDYMFYDGDEPTFVSKISFFKKVNALCKLTSPLHSDEGMTPFNSLETVRLDIQDSSNWVTTGISILDGRETHD